MKTKTPFIPSSLHPFLILFLALFLSSSLFAQVPQGIPYQAMIRGNDGAALANANVTVRFTLHQNTTTGEVEYQETQALTTNAHGLINTQFGQGTPTQGTFAGIVWSNTSKFIQVEANDGNGYVDMGTQQMMSVPYAMYSGSANTSNSANTATTSTTAGNGFSSVSATGDTLYLANGNFIVIPGISLANHPSIENGGLGSQVLAGNSTCAVQNISITGCGGQTSLTYDERTYGLVEIGGQCWFADNLATDQYNNGDPIPTGLDNIVWQNTTSGAYVIYNDDIANDVTYGKLYNWFTTMDTRGVCPIGWHIPSDCEWMYLESSLGMQVFDQEGTGYRGNNEGGLLKSISYWNSPNVGANNGSDFSALPGGFFYSSGNFSGLGNNGHWWTRSEYDTNGAWYRVITNDMSSVLRTNNLKQYGFSVRCLKN